MNWKTVIFFFMALSVPPVEADPQSDNQVVVRKWCYTIALSDSGELKIVFDSAFKREDRKYLGDKNDVKLVFSLLKSNAFQSLEEKYVAWPETFASYGHESLETISYKVAGQIKKSVEWGSSRTDIPPTLKQISELINKMARETGPLPVQAIY